jgi:hypothetical protein
MAIPFLLGAPATKRRLRAMQLLLADLELKHQQPD